MVFDPSHIFLKLKDFIIAVNYCMQNFYCVTYFITYKHTKTKHDSKNSEGWGRVLCRSNLVEPGRQ